MKVVVHSEDPAEEEMAQRIVPALYEWLVAMMKFDRDSIPSDHRPTLEVEFHSWAKELAKEIGGGHYLPNLPHDMDLHDKSGAFTYQGFLADDIIQKLDHQVVSPDVLWEDIKKMLPKKSR